MRVHHDRAKSEFPVPSSDKICYRTQGAGTALKATWERRSWGLFPSRYQYPSCTTVFRQVLQNSAPLTSRRSTAWLEAITQRQSVQ